MWKFVPRLLLFIRNCQRAQKNPSELVFFVIFVKYITTEIIHKGQRNAVEESCIYGSEMCEPKKNELERKKKTWNGVAIC